MTRAWHLAGYAALLIGCAGGARPPAAASRAARPPPSAPAWSTPPSFAFLVVRDEVMEVAFCCEEGSCRTESCDSLLGAGEEVAYADGTRSTIEATRAVACPGQERAAYVPGRLPARAIAPAVWPAASSAKVWWRGKHHYLDAAGLAPEMRAQVAMPDSHPLDLEAYEVIAVDLDDDGVDEEILAITGLQGGVFLQRDDHVERVAAMTRPEVRAATDLDGDGLRELLVVDVSVEPPQLIVLDVFRSSEIVRTPYFCRERPSEPAHGV